jgi:ribonuclease HI
MAVIDIYTDGSCLGNPGPGGWAAILATTINDKPYSKEFGGDALNTTNNEMEMQAVLGGLKALNAPGCSVRIHTDSQLVMGYFSMGWKCKKLHLQKIKTAVLEVIRDLDLTVEWVKVKGHAGHEMNERADELAVCHANAAKDRLEIAGHVAEKFQFA